MIRKIGNNNALKMCAIVLCVTLCSACESAASEPRRLLILHTGDMHDHLRPGYIGIGGLAHIAGYVRDIRADRDDVLLVDAGDVTEKGDLVAYRSNGEVSFEAMGRIGYDAVTVGNHDLDFGMPQMRRFEELMGQPFLLRNLESPLGEPVFDPSRIVEIGGLRVGLIGMINPRKPHLGGLDEEASGAALADEAQTLEPRTDVIVALCHDGVEQVSRWARMAPEVDVLVAGHRHETLTEPVIIEETGAIVVAAGSDAHWVGRLELEVDPETGDISDHHGELVLMRHDRIAADEDFLTWFEQRVEALAPQANEPVASLDAPLGWFAVARLGAEAIRERAGADVGLFHPAQIVRNSLPAGEIDHNAVFRIAAERVDPIIELEMKGAEIEAYLDALSMSNWGQTQWAGFSVDITTRDAEHHNYKTDLDQEQIYSVVMPEREYDRYLKQQFEHAYVRTIRERFADSRDDLPRQRQFPAKAVDWVFAGVLAEYLRGVEDAGERVSDRLDALQRQQGDTDPNEPKYEPRLVRQVDPEYYKALEEDG